MIPFAKYSGCGNDFILIDNRNGSLDPTSEPIQQLCHRSCGIGADGVILLEESLINDYKMRIFNADGSEAEMCGNGLRCLGKFLHDRKIVDKQFTIEVWGLSYTLHIHGKTITVSMPSPTIMKWDQQFEIANQAFTYDFLDTGVPHVIVYDTDIDEININTLGSSIRQHKNFSPAGTNVDFVQKLGKTSLKIRTYERGVEAETLGCGTGASAAAISFSKKENISAPITVETKSGDHLTFDFHWEGPNIKDLTMAGPALFHFHGEANCLFQLNP